MEDSRTSVLSDERLHRLCVASNDDSESLFEVGELPESLSVKEVNHVGSQVVDHIERQLPSHSGDAYGTKAKIRVISALGAEAVAIGDYVSAESVVTYMRGGQGLTGKIWSAVIGHALNKSIKDDIKASLPR